MKRSKEQSKGVQLVRRKTSVSSWRRFTLKAILSIAFLFIILIYSHLLSQISMKKRGRHVPSNNNKNSDAISSTSNASSSKAVLVIAAVPFHYSRAFSLWSQLECFTKNIDKVVIAAADFSKDLLDPFIHEAVEAIPHLRDGTVQIEVKYYKNDRYDIGLWCDALTDGKGTGVETDKSLVSQFDHFMLINDSIMAIQRSSELIDVTRSKKLKMGSLTYSLLGGYWLEANYRSFNSEGIKTFMEHVCIPNPCLEKRGKRAQHRCMVDTFEIPIASYFQRNEVWGLYHGDATIEYFNATRKNKVLQTSPMWHSNFPYWDEILRAKLNFPAAKISNRKAYFYMKKKNIEDHDRCLITLKKSKMAYNITTKFDQLMEKADSLNVMQFIN